MERAKRAPAAASVVLGDGDLLGEILLRVAFPTTLLRAALVCKTWYRRASDPAFLRRFRDLHPPRLLGFYVDLSSARYPQFVPLPQPPELAALVRRASFDLDTADSYAAVVRRSGYDLDTFGDFSTASVDAECWNGRLYLMLYNRLKYIKAVRSPLLGADAIAILPDRPAPPTSSRNGFWQPVHDFIPNHGSEGPPYIFLAIGCGSSQTIAHVFLIRDGVWNIHAMAEADLPFRPRKRADIIFVDETIYLVGECDKKLMLVMLNISSLRFSFIEFPDEVSVVHEYSLPEMLSLADGSGVYMINVKGFQLHVWLHRIRMSSEDKDNWMLVDTISLSELCANQGMSTWVLEDLVDDYVTVHAVTNNANFVFFEIGDGVIYLLDVRGRSVKMVYQYEVSHAILQQHRVTTIKPFMMIWPPIFPILMEGCEEAQ